MRAEKRRTPRRRRDDAPTRPCANAGRARRAIPSGVERIYRTLATSDATTSQRDKRPDEWVVDRPPSEIERPQHDQEQSNSASPSAAHQLKQHYEHSNNKQNACSGYLNDCTLEHVLSPVAVSAARVAASECYCAVRPSADRPIAAPIEVSRVEPLPAVHVKETNV